MKSGRNLGESRLQDILKNEASAVRSEKMASLGATDVPNEAVSREVGKGDVGDKVRKRGRFQRSDSL